MGINKCTLSPKLVFLCPHSNLSMVSTRFQDGINCRLSMASNNSKSSGIHDAPPLANYVAPVDIFDRRDPETGQFRHSVGYYVTKIDFAYCATFADRCHEVSDEQFVSAMKLIPDAEIYPPIPGNLTITNQSDTEEVHIKRPAITDYDEKQDNSAIPRDILDEACIMECVARVPHPNIVHYYGCRVRRGRIVGLVTERLGYTLKQHSETPAFLSLDKQAFYRALLLAVAHLHKMGLAHNDIKPSNVMVKNGMPVLIDFGSCRPFNTKLLGTTGTMGWSKNQSGVSHREHDEYALEVLWRWLCNPTQPLSRRGLWDREKPR